MNKLVIYLCIVCSVCAVVVNASEDEYGDHANKHPYALPSVEEGVSMRRTVREYADSDSIPIDDDVLRELDVIARDITRGPLGSLVKIGVYEHHGGTGHQMRPVDNVHDWIVGAVQVSRKPDVNDKITSSATSRENFFQVNKYKINKASLVDYGYCFEKMIIEASRRGFATIWLDRDLFKPLLNVPSDYHVVAISPIGHAASDGRVRRGDDPYAGKYTPLDEVDVSDKTAWGSRLHDTRWGQYLGKSSVPDYIDALEAVRLAPSAFNDMPCHVVYEHGGDIDRFSFYSQMPGKYYSFVGVGICMYHFEAVLGETSRLNGTWTVIDDVSYISAPLDATYVATWSRVN